MNFAPDKYSFSGVCPSFSPSSSVVICFIFSTFNVYVGIFLSCNSNVASGKLFSSVILDDFIRVLISGVSPWSIICNVYVPSLLFILNFMFPCAT